MRIIGSEIEIRQNAPGGVPVRIVRSAPGQPWHIEGDVPLTRKNRFNHLREASAYLRGLKRGKND